MGPPKGLTAPPGSGWCLWLQWVLGGRYLGSLVVSGAATSLATESVEACMHSSSSGKPVSAVNNPGSPDAPVWRHCLYFPHCAVYYVLTVCGLPHVLSHHFALGFFYMCYRAFGLLRNPHCGMASRKQTNKQRPHSLMRKPPAWRAIGRACTRVGVQTADRQADGQAPRCTDRHSQTHTQPSTLTCLFCAAAAGPGCCRHTLLLCFPPPPSQRKRGCSVP